MKSLNTVVLHEITHILEGTELYDALHQSLVAYAKAKGDYDGRYKAIEKLYEGIEGADINKELTADLVGDYLFTDENFIRNLSTEQPGVFKKVYDEIKYLCKVATAGSKEARELEKIKKMFSDIYRDSGKAQKNTTEEGVPYSSLPDGHDWLDANGWLHRTANVINVKNGNVYQITMDIAKTKDGRFILYALNWKTKKVGNADVNSLVIKTTSGSEQNSNSNDIVPQTPEESSGNTSHSLSTEDAQAVKHGDYHVTGEDVRFAPVREDIAEKSQNKAQKAQKLSNPPPLRKDITPQVPANVAHGEDVGATGDDITQKHLHYSLLFIT